MAFQSVPNTVEVIIDYLFSGAPAANVLHFTRASMYNQVDIDAFAANIDSVIGPGFAGQFTPTQQYVGTRVRGLTDQNDLQGANSDHAFTGTVEQTALPNNVSLCLTVRTGQTGRSARGRIYCPPPNEGDLVGPNEISLTYASAMVSVYRACRTIGNATGWGMTVVSRRTNKALRPVGVVFVVSDIIARNHRLDSQRGRMPGPA